MATGTIKTLRNGFGFILPDGSSKDVHFTGNALKNASFNELQVGQRVTSFTTIPGKEGKPTAKDVEVEEVVRIKIKDVIAEGGDTLIEAARNLGQELAAKKLKTAQIRKVYSAVKKIQLNQKFNRTSWLC